MDLQPQYRSRVDPRDLVPLSWAIGIFVGGTRGQREDCLIRSQEQVVVGISGEELHLSVGLSAVGLKR